MLFLRFVWSLSILLFPWCAWLWLPEIGLSTLSAIFASWCVISMLLAKHNGGRLLMGLLAGIVALSGWQECPTLFLCYPAIMSFTLAIVGGLSLYSDRPLVKTIIVRLGLPIHPALHQWWHFQTALWSIIFLLNGLGTLLTVFYFTSPNIWTLYNGLINYLIMLLVIVVSWHQAQQRIVAWNRVHLLHEDPSTNPFIQQN